MDNIKKKATEHGDYAYDYDDIYRLIDADNPTLDDEAFAYDPVGNRLTAEGVVGTWNYNTNNELTGYDNVSYEYDANGNMTQKTAGGVVTKFFYNTEDRLERVEDAGGTLIAAYYYDPFGRRLWKEVDGTRTCFLYADEGLIGEYNSTGGEIKTYGYKPGSTWTTDPLFMKEGSDYYFYHNDHLGTPQRLTATNGAVVWSSKYSSFGEAEIELISTITNNLRFPGQYFDEETGLYYNYHRYYDPRTGRYIKPDPLGIEGGDLNLFSYVRNNPVLNIDPLGKGLLNILLCSYYGSKVAKYSDQCRKELYQLYDKYNQCPAEGDLEFMKRYQSSFLSEAMARCTYEKCPDKKLAYKWLKACFKGAWSLPSVRPLAEVDTENDNVYS